jgi:RHS repeat-associated protein
MAMTKQYFTVNGEIIGEQTTGQERIDYLTDPLGNVTATIDQNAKVLNRYTYKPFGEVLSKEGTAPDPKFLWVGAHGYRQTGKKYADVYVRARHYDTRTGRWTSRDSIGYRGGMNLYNYIRGNPIIWADPSGLHPCLIPCIPCASCAIDLVLVCSDCGSDLRCWSECIEGTINELPAWLRWICATACGSCITCLLSGVTPAPPVKGKPRKPNPPKNGKKPPKPDKPKKWRWYCIGKCALRPPPDTCTGYTTGEGWGMTESEACNAAKTAAVHNKPQGMECCGIGHCYCPTCRKK